MGDTSFIVHQHHHYGWSTHKHTAASPEAAMIADVRRTHDFLAKYDHRIEIGSDGW